MIRFAFLIILIIGFFLCLTNSFALTKGENDLGFSLPAVFIYDSEGRRDPFLSLIVERKKVEPKVEQPKPKETPKQILEESDYILLGLIWDEEKIFALIKTKKGKWIVQEGSIIDRFRVLKIDRKKEEVVLVGEKEIIKLRMRK